MQKIIVAIDGLNYKESVVEFAISLTKHLHSHLIGLFLHDKTYHSYRIYDIESGALMTEEQIARGEIKDVSLRKNAIQAFDKACALQTIRHTNREDKNIALPELIHESIYTDLLLINSGEKFTHYPENRPSAFVRELLEKTHCPVILVPDVVQPIKKAILLYDGTPESVYAIKMFCTHMSGYGQLSVEVLSVNKPNQSLHLSDNRLIREYLKRHFPKAAVRVIKGDASLKITAALKKERADTLVVMGAYRRGLISRWFRPSKADILLSNLKLPLFISHGI